MKSKLVTLTFDLHKWVFIVTHLLMPMNNQAKYSYLNPNSSDDKSNEKYNFYTPSKTTYLAPLTPYNTKTVDI